MTGPSSGDRPAEETCDPACPGTKCERRGRAWCPDELPLCTPCGFRHEGGAEAHDRPATPPAVRTGDDARCTCPDERAPASFCSIPGHVDDFARNVATPPPVSGTATRDGEFMRRYVQEARNTAWRDGYEAGRSAGLGGSQPAADGQRAAEQTPNDLVGGVQPVQPAEEQRPDDGLRRLVERIRELAPSAVKAAEHDLGITR